jgi:TPR repeat protein
MSRVSRSLLHCILAATALTITPVQASSPPTTADQRLQEAASDFEKGDYQGAWFRFWCLAQEGSAPAQFNLGQLYRLGIGVPTELIMARYWYAEAAAQGHAFAQYNLGLMYELGHGTSADAIEAVAWYRRAAAQDVPGASGALQRLEQRAKNPGEPGAPRPSLSDATAPAGASLRDRRF